MTQPVRQHRVVLPGIGAVHLDLAWPDILLGIEVDHVTWHGGRIETQRDKARDRALMRPSWTIVRVTDEDIDGHLDQTIDDLTAIIGRLSRTCVD